MTLSPGETLLNGQYEILSLLGRGGFGHVYRARDRVTGETVAIKELVPDLVGEPQMVQRFIQEARATLRLTHPKIARTYNIFQEGATYYLVMEYLAGGSLASRLRTGPQPAAEALRVVADLCTALDYAHGQGVVHCDIKPGNVLFDAEGGVHLADFGIAHVTEDLMTRHVVTGTGAAMGTVRYMAPEQLEGVRDDPRLDVYALGALLYEMLAGRPYLDFETETTPAAQMRNMQRIQRESPRPLRAINPAATEWLGAVVARALRKAQDERYPTAGALREALQPPAPGQAPGREVRQQSPGPLNLVLPDGGEVALATGSLTLGCAPGVDVALSEPQVSRRHAVIDVAADGVHVVDLGSTHGTFIKGERLAPHTRHRLQTGDTLRLGDALTLRVQARKAQRPPAVGAASSTLRAATSPTHRAFGFGSGALTTAGGIACLVLAAAGRDRGAAAMSGARRGVVGR